MIRGRHGVVNVSQPQDVSANAPQTIFVNAMTCYANQTEYMTYVSGMGNAQLTKQGRGNTSAATTLFMVPQIPINRGQESRLVGAKQAVRKGEASKRFGVEVRMTSSPLTEEEYWEAQLSHHRAK